jgi:hypothetical protein
MAGGRENRCQEAESRSQGGERPREQVRGYSGERQTARTREGCDYRVGWATDFPGPQVDSVTE